MPIQFENKVMTFYPSLPKTEPVTLRGGLPFLPEEDDRCCSGNHSLKLTQCYCHWEKLVKANSPK
jgi:hypothetical protein